MVLPAPPYAFPSARICYQPRLVRTAAAHATLPPGVMLLSLFGWTLGGVFVVDWRASPVGPYKEVAILSALVARDWTLGAWASHLIVTSDAAADAGELHWGLPTVSGSLELTAAAAADGEATIHFDSATHARLEGWDGWDTSITDEKTITMNQPIEESAPSFPQQFGLELPSLSGGLKRADGTHTPLLRYPLTVSAGSLRLRPPIKIGRGGLMSGGGSSRGGESTEKPLDALLRATLEGCAAAPCLQIDGASVVAGRAVEVGGGSLSEGGGGSLGLELGGSVSEGAQQVSLGRAVGALGSLRGAAATTALAVAAAGAYQLWGGGLMGGLMPPPQLGNGWIGFEPSYFLAITRMLESGARGPGADAFTPESLPQLGAGIEALLADY